MDSEWMNQGVGMSRTRPWAEVFMYTSQQAAGRENLAVEVCRFLGGGCADVLPVQVGAERGEGRSVKASRKHDAAH